MKYLKLYENHQTEEEIHRLCRKYEIEDYIINDDMSIDVNANVNLDHNYFKKLPLNFNYISGDFNCSNNNLISLEGSPKEVGGSFYCNINLLTSLEGAPEKVGGNFGSDINKLTSLKGVPKIIHGFFNCSNNKLTSLEGSPEKVGDYFGCSNNKLKTLEGAPKIVGDKFYCYDNELESLNGIPRVAKDVHLLHTGFEDLVKILKYKGPNVYYYSTHNKAIHRYGLDTIYLPMFNRLLKKLNIDEVDDVKGFTIIKTVKEGEEYLNAN